MSTLSRHLDPLYRIPYYQVSMGVDLATPSLGQIRQCYAYEHLERYCQLSVRERAIALVA